MQRIPRAAVTSLIAAATLCALAGAPVSAAHAADPAPMVAAEQVVQRFSVAGTVQAVNYDANTITIKSAGKRIELVLEPTTSIDDRGQQGSISDIHRGRKLLAEGIVRNGVFVAQTIRLR
ncbi:MAG: hypothetical protein M3Z37_07810 [Candidatus Eremiobacteraeota bacterium]|nr:hypothetical protein [Candidatus Eremiobacteraeota bacterium]